FSLEALNSRASRSPALADSEPATTKPPPLRAEAALEAPSPPATGMRMIHTRKTGQRRRTIAAPSRANGSFIPWSPFVAALLHRPAGPAAPRVSCRLAPRAATPGGGIAAGAGVAWSGGPSPAAGGGGG